MPEKQFQSSNRIRETLGKLYEHQPPHFREYMRRYQEDPTSRVFAPLAEAYRRLGRLDEAIDICLEGLKHHPDFPGGRVALARCFLDKKKYAKAKDELERVIGVSPDNILAQRLLGDCLFNLDEKSRALHCYKIASVLAPDDVGLQDKVHRLEQQMARGDFDERVYQGNVSDGVAPTSSSQPIAIPISKESSELVEEVVFVEQSVKDPSPHQSFYEHSNLAEIDRALGSLEPILDDSEESDEIRQNQIDAILGFEDDSIEAYKTENVSQVFSEDKYPSPEITTQTLGELYLSQGQYEKALKIFEKLQKSRPTADLAQKIQECRAFLGVDFVSIRRQQKIDMLNSILNKNRKKD